MHDVFISYSRPDKERADLLTDILRANGCSVWIDDCIQPRAHWPDELSQAIEQASCVIVLWSRSTSKKLSHWVREEAHAALDRKVLIPVRLDNIQPPFGFRTVEAIDLSDWHGQQGHPELNKLFEQITALSGHHFSHVKENTQEPDLLNAALPITMLTVGAAAIVSFLVTPEIWADGLWFSAALLSVFIVVLFSLADKDMAVHLKALFRSWLQPASDSSNVERNRAFRIFFETLFGPRHNSRRCVASVILLSTALFAIVLASTFFNDWEASHDISFGTSLLLFAYFAPTNVINYISLFFVRLGLIYSLPYPYLVVASVGAGLFGLLGSLLAFLLVDYLNTCIFSQCDLSVAEFYGTMQTWAKKTFYFSSGPSLTDSILLSTVFPSFTFALVLIFFLGAQPAFQMIKHSHSSFLLVLSTILNVDGRPIAAFGWIAGGLLFTTTTLSWLLSKYAT